MKNDPADRIDEARRKYERSPKGKASKKKYNTSPKGKEAKRKHEKSERGRLTQLKYYYSTKGKETRENRQNLNKLARLFKDYLEVNPKGTFKDFSARLKERNGTR